MAMENSNKMKIWFFENVNQRQSIIQSDQEKKKKSWGFVENNQNNKIKTEMEKSQHTTQKHKRS